MTKAEKTQVEEKIAEFIEQHLGVEMPQVLSGKPFLDLHPDFDSLMMIEISGMLEDHYGVRFEFGGVDGRIPSNVHELADLVLATLTAKTVASSPCQTSPISGHSNTQ